MASETIHLDGVGFSSDFILGFPTVTDWIKETAAPHYKANTWPRATKKEFTERMKTVYKIAHNGK